MKEPVTIERLERALVLAAYVVIRHGRQYAPHVDRLEKELEAARRDDPVARSKSIIADHMQRNGLTGKFDPSKLKPSAKPGRSEAK